MVSDGKCLVNTILNFTVSSPCHSYSWSYVIISLPFMASSLIKLTFILGNLCIITGGLVIHTYFWKVQRISLLFMTQCDLVNYHICTVSSQYSPVVHFYIHIFDVHLHFKIIYHNIYIGVYKSRYIIYLLFFHLSPHIYHSVWLIIFFEF